MPDICFTSEEKRAQITLKALLRELLGVAPELTARRHVKELLLEGKLCVVKLANYGSPTDEGNLQCIQEALAVELPVRYQGRVLSVTHNGSAQALIKLFTEQDHELLQADLECGHGIALTDQDELSIHSYRDLWEKE